MTSGGVSRRRFLAGAAVGGAALSAPGILTLPKAAFSADNAVQAENALPGTSDWEPRRNGWGVLGFPAAPSVAAGGTLAFHFVPSTANAGRNVAVDVFRLGYYGGLGARRVAATMQVNSGPSLTPVERDLENGLVEAPNPVAFELTTSTSGQPWVSGVYVAKLTAPDGSQSLVPFVVRDDTLAAKYLFLHPANDHVAYNSYGGNSMYAFGTAYGQSFDFQFLFWHIWIVYNRRSASWEVLDHAPSRCNKVSFLRPFGGNDHVVGAGELFRHEYRVLRFMEEQGLDVSYACDRDLHYWSGSGASLRPRQVGAGTRALVIPSHCEYWTSSMYDSLEWALARGAGLAHFAANSIYWNGRFEESADGSVADATYTLYKGAANGFAPATQDPLRGDAKLASGLYRAAHLGRPEQKVFGGMYDGWVNRGTAGQPEVGQDSFGHLPMVVADTSHSVFSGTGIAAGDTFVGLCGGEFDREISGYAKPSNLTKICRTPIPGQYAAGGIDKVQESVLHEQTSILGNKWRVFNAGTFNWPWGLDNFSFDRDTSGRSKYLTDVANPFGADTSMPGKGFADTRVRTLTNQVLRWVAKLA